MTREQVNDYITRRLAWDEAVKMSPHRCPNCGEGAQVQILDTVDDGGPLWKCRICRYRFHTDAPNDVPFPYIEPNP